LKQWDQQGQAHIIRASGVTAMNDYTVRARSSLFIAIVVSVIFGAIPVLALVHGNGGPVSAIVGVTTLWWLYSTLRSVHTIRVGIDGSIHFVRLLGTTRLFLQDISVLEGFRKHEYEGMVWKMRVRYGQNTITVPLFDGAPEFISLVRILAPSINVQGEWPLLDPWGTTV
jgi:hypothetical protein